jgi:hypothetical protein
MRKSKSNDRFSRKRLENEMAKPFKGASCRSIISLDEEK